MSVSVCAHAHACVPFSRTLCSAWNAAQKRPHVCVTQMTHLLWARKQSTGHPGQPGGTDGALPRPPPGASGCRRRSAGGGPGHEAAGWPSAAAGRSLGKTLFTCGRLCFKFSREETAPEIRSLSSSFRFKAEFLAAASLPSSGTPHSPSEATRGHDLSAPSLRRRLAAELRDVASPTRTHSGAGEGALGSRDPNWKVAFYEAAFPRNAETKP